MIENFKTNPAAVQYTYAEPTKHELHAKIEALFAKKNRQPCFMYNMYKTNRLAVEYVMRITKDHDAPYFDCFDMLIKSALTTLTPEIESEELIMELKSLLWTMESLSPSWNLVTEDESKTFFSQFLEMQLGQLLCNPLERHLFAMHKIKSIIQTLKTANLNQSAQDPTCLLSRMPAELLSTVELYFS